MQKYLLKQQFEGFSVSTSEGLHKGYDRFQTLLSQLEMHGAGVSHENANQKFLRSLHSFWSQVALIMRTKPGLDTFSFDDLYNNIRVFERDVKSTTASSLNTQNVVSVSAKNTSSTNDVSNAYSVSSLFVSKSQKEGSSSYTDEVIHSFFENQSSAPQLDYDDLEQINDDDIEEMDLKWQVAMISMRIKKFHKRIGRKLQSDTKDRVGFDKTKVECFNYQKIRHFSRDYRAKGNQNSRRRDTGYNGNKTKDNGRRPAYQDDSKALVTIDGEDIDWSGHVEKDAQNYAILAYSSRNSGSDIEVKFCSKACEESYARHKKWYDDQKDKLGDANVEITSYTLALKKASALEDTPINDRFADGMHVIPPLMTGNYMPSGPDVDIDYSKFTYVPKQTLADESDSKPSNYASCESDFSVETSMPEPVENASKVVCEPKVWTDAPIIEEALKDKGIVDNGCSRHMTGNKAHLADYQEFKGGSVSFVSSNEMITGKGKIKTGRLDFEDVYYLEELKHYNLLSVSQMCDKKNKVLFTDTDCLVLSPDFKFPDENQVLLKIPRQHNMYSFNLKNINPSRDLACLFAKASIDESNKWHRRCDNGTEFKNKELIEFCRLKGIKREHSNARNPQQIGVAERKNMTLIEAARTMLADSFLPTTFWAEAVNTACYVLNRVLVTKPQNKTPYELLSRKGHAWMFDLDYLTNSMNYEPVLVENQANKSAGPKEANNSAGDKIEKNIDFKTCEKPISQVEQVFLEELEKLKRQEKEANDAAESLRKEATYNI
nr:ribonuclease H-like domain-containing protein [Tanacetum cinerariifolium]